MNTSINIRTHINEIMSHIFKNICFDYYSFKVKSDFKNSQVTFICDVVSGDRLLRCENVISFAKLVQYTINSETIALHIVNTMNHGFQEKIKESNL